MGLVIGYILTKGGADVTFLVRPHRAEILSRPQLLYSYDDGQLQKFSQYKFITNPSDIKESEYNYIVITLDAYALKSEAGTTLVKIIGDAVRGSQTRIILGTAFIGVKSWFLKISDIDEARVVWGGLAIHVYEPRKVTLPLHGGTDLRLLEQADQAYTDKLGAGFTVDDSSPEVARGFAQLWNASRTSTCAVAPATYLATSIVTMFVIFAASELLHWPSYEDVDIDEEHWVLAIEAMKELRGLSMCGKEGQMAMETTTAAGVRDQFVAIEKLMRPLDWVAFSKYHHGMKVKAQDRAQLRDWVACGEAEGKPMSATKELIKRVEEH